MSDFDFSSDDLEFVDSNDSLEDGYSSFESSNIEQIDNVELSDTSSTNKRVVIFASIIGFGLILVGLGGSNMLSNIKNKLDSRKEVVQTIDKEVVQKEEISNSQISINDVTNDYNSNIIKREENGWVECTISDYVSPNEPIQSIFTVSDIRTFFKKENVNDTPSIKYILKGNISGLVGIFEIEVGYSIGSRLTLGQQLNILYSTIVINNQNIVSELSLMDFN